MNNTPMVYKDYKEPEQEGMFKEGEYIVVFPKNGEEAKKQKEEIDEKSKKIEEEAKKKAEAAKIVEFDEKKDEDRLKNRNLFRKLFEEYGNNAFMLSTITKVEDKADGNKPKNRQVTVGGILKDIPEFGLSSTWDTGPLASAMDWLKNFLNDDLAECMNYLGSNGMSEYVNPVKTEANSTRIYTGSDDVSFNLEFRIYNGQTIGSQPMTSIKDMVLFLSNYTVPQEMNDLPAVFLDNLKGVATSGARITKDIFTKPSGKEKTALGSAFSGTKNKDLTKDRVYNDLNAFNQLGAKIFQLYILPFIFKHPLIGYISNWNVEYSKEYNEDIGGNFYADFSITFNLDQKWSYPSFRNLT